MTRKVIRAAAKSTLPVLMGYVTMGMAAGILLAKHGGISNTPLWGFLTSATSISGALQFLLVDWCRNKTALLDVAILTLCLNMRYAMYGISLISRWRGISPWKKMYLIWAMTDETYALEVENKVPEGESSLSYCLAVCFFDHCYWVSGVVLGTIMGALPFNSTGIDFTMTALFMVILIDQCKERTAWLPAAIGLCSAIVCRGLFPQGKMLIPTMALLLGILIILWHTTFKKKEAKQ